MPIVQPQTIAQALNITGAKVVQRSKKMGGGFEGRVTILRVELGNTRNGGALFVKFRVDESNDQDNVPVGSERTWKQSLMTSKGPEPAMANILFWTACCAAACGESIDVTDTQAIEAMSGELNAILQDAVSDPENVQGKNVFVGLPLNLVTDETTTEQGRKFVVHMWSP